MSTNPKRIYTKRRAGEPALSDPPMLRPRHPNAAEQSDRERERDPQKVGLSYSQIADYELCPRLYQHSRELRDLPSAPSSIPMAGTALHAAIALDLRMRIGLALALGNDVADPEDFPPMKDERFLEVAAEQWERVIAEEDPQHLLDPFELEYQRARVLGAALCYIREVAPGLAPMDAERRVYFTHPDDHRISFVGFVDAIILRTYTDEATGRITKIVRSGMDWKLSKPWRPGDEHRSDQPTAYDLSLRRMGEPPIEQFSYGIFAPGEGVLTLDEYVELRRSGVVQTPVEMWPAVCYRLTTHRGDGTRAAYSAKILRTAAAIRRHRSEGGEWPAAPKWKCQFCPVLNVGCAEGWDYLRANGKRPRIPVLPEALPADFK